MAIHPAPTNGAVLEGVGVAGRVLRISGHPELGIVVLSIWQDERCVATVRLAESDVPELVRAIAAAAVHAPTPLRAAG
jgi:hypothetical protein